MPRKAKKKIEECPVCPEQPCIHSDIPPKKPSILDPIIDQMKALPSDADRLAVMKNFCEFCGSLDPKCQCWCLAWKAKSGS